MIIIGNKHFDGEWLTRVSDVANFWNGNLENHFAKGTGYPDWTLTPDYQGMQSEILVAKIRNQFWPNNRTELYKFSRVATDNRRSSVLERL